MRQKMNFINVTPVDPDDIARTVREIRRRAKEVGLTKVALSLSFHPQGTPAKVNADRLLKAHRDIRAALGPESGIELGVLVQSLLGHGWSGAVPLTEEPWQNIVFDNGWKSSRICPLDPGFQDYVVYCVGSLVRDGAEFLLIDDDFGLRHEECCCPAHLEQYRKATGMNWQTPQEAGEYMKSHPWDDPAAVKVSELRGKVIWDLAKRMRAAMDQYNPDISCAMCTPWSGKGIVRELGLIFAGKNDPVVRVDNAIYGLQHPLNYYGLTYQTYCVRHQLAGIKNTIDESDTCPQSIYSESAAVFNAHVINGILCGLNGCKLWMAGFGTNGTPDSQKRYEKIFAKNRGLYEELLNTVQGIQWKGTNTILIDWEKERFLHMLESGKPLLVSEWNVPIMGPFAVPLAFGEQNPNITTLTADVAEHLSDDSIRELFKGNLLIDSSAAKALTERGFAELMGVTADQGPKDFFFTTEINQRTGEWVGMMADEGMAHLTVLDPAAEVVTTFHRGHNFDNVIAPATVHYTNKLGGRVAVLGWYPGVMYMKSMRTLRKEWMLQTLDFLNGEPLDMVVDTDFQVLVRHGVLPDGEELFSAMSLAFDSDDEIRIRCHRPVKKLLRLGHDGRWIPAEFVQEDGICRIQHPLCLVEANIYKFTF